MLEDQVIAAKYRTPDDDVANDDAEVEIISPSHSTKNNVVG